MKKHKLYTEKRFYVRAKYRVQIFKKYTNLVKMIKILYLKRGTVLVFFVNKQDVNKLINKYYNKLIKVIKLVNVIIIEIKIIIK